ncbi:VWA domain-containing protein [Primorskyibacter sp. S87]|uniref:VWA domain-containing protein n=1 Tax=Primorskyibacter sp. S87 TaxID=3415126 RepID=UPI003C7E444B
MEQFAAFHFIQPLWLLAVPVLLLLWWLIRRREQTGSAPVSGIAPHLAAAMTVGGSDQARLRPIDGVILSGLLLTLAAAGPTWTRAPNPLLADTAPLVVALKVTDSMSQSDLAPTRLDRAKFKILDLIAARAGGRTALIAYSGTAHRVAPLTEDPNILRPLLEGLTPEVMPEPGDVPGAALQLAQGILNDAETPGAVLFVLDDLPPGAVTTLTGEDAPETIILTALPDGQSLPQLAGSGLSVIPLANDDRDIERIMREAEAAYVAALQGDERLHWEDRGWILAWPAALIILLWFRRGWTMQWVFLAALLSGFAAPDKGHAEGWHDWFLTPDQQGQIAMNRKDFNKAATLFADPYLRAYAMLRAGQYPEAADLFAMLPSPEAAFGEGMARIRNREYRPAIRAFETALERRPGWPEAEQNLELSKAILDYVETAREQSDTGEESGIGADDVVFDNEAQRGADTQIEAPKEDAAPLNAESWITSIDTDMGDFLRSRFILENQGRDQ